MADSMVAAEVLLLVLTPVSFFPQYSAMLSSHSSAGISTTATFLLTLAAQTQVATMAFALSWVPGTRYGETSDSASQLCFPQIVIQWLCSGFLLALVLATDTGPTGDTSDDIPTASSQPCNATISIRTMAILLAIQIALLWWWYFFGPKGNDYAFFAVSAINEYIVNPLMTISIVAAFVLQARMSSTWHVSSSLSNTSLFLQTAVFAVLSILWPMRIRLPPGLNRFGVDPGLMWEWYRMVGWACVNNGIIALGQAVVLFLFWKSGRDRSLQVG